MNDSHSGTLPGDRRQDQDDASERDQPTSVDVDEFLGVPKPKPWYRRPVILIAVAAALLALWLLSRLFGGTASVAYTTEPARREDLTVTVSATGNLQPTNQVTVGSEQSGLVEAVYVDNNDRVTKGQPLARLDTSRLNDTLNQAKAALESAASAVVTAQATAQQSETNLRRQEEVFRLSDGKVPSQAELDTARADVSRAHASIRSAQAQVAQAKAQVSSAQTSLAKATIYSPVNGVVLSRSVDPGQTVAASLQAPTLFTLAEDLRRMELEVKVDEADVGQVDAGQHASFTVDAYPGRTFEAVIKRVDLGANASSGGSSSSSSSASSSSSSSTSAVVAYGAVLTVQNPDLLLRPGMTATAAIVTTTRPGVLVVSNAALRFRPASGAGQPSGVTSVLMPRPRFGNETTRTATIGRGSTQTVFVLGAEGQPQSRRITVGSTDGSITEVTGGELKAGEKVITGQLAAGSGAGSRSASGARGG